MGETEREVLTLVQQLVDLGGHSHLFCFFPEKGTLMDHLPATPRDQWRRVQLARYLMDYCGVRVEQMRFDDEGRVTDFGLPPAELERHHRRRASPFAPRAAPASSPTTSRPATGPMATSPPANIASYPVPAATSQGTLPEDPPQLRIAGRGCDGLSGVTGRSASIDTGVRRGRAFNMAFDQAMIELHQRGTDPGHDPLSALPALGAGRPPPGAAARRSTCRLPGSRRRHRAARHRRRGALPRRGPVRLGNRLPPQRARAGHAAELARDICEAAAAGLSQLGIDARYRPRNDIEVEGRKISAPAGSSTATRSSTRARCWWT